MTTLGYARVSTVSQTLDQQHDALIAEGVERIFDDTMSGARDDRPGLHALLDYARKTDVIVVVRGLTGWAAHLRGVLETIDELQRREIVLRSFGVYRLLYPVVACWRRCSRPRRVRET